MDFGIIFLVEPTDSSVAIQLCLIGRSYAQTGRGISLGTVNLVDSAGLFSGGTEPAYAQGVEARTSFLHGGDGIEGHRHPSVFACVACKIGVE